jgi:hypothetical protein
MRDIFIGTIGSIIGALIVFIATSGFRLNKRARERSRARRAAEEKCWREGGISQRQEITNEYLFNILKHMLLGNLFWAMGGMFASLFYSFIWEASLWTRRINTLVGITNALGAFFFAIGLAWVLRYARLKRMPVTNKSLDEQVSLIAPSSEAAIR